MRFVTTTIILLTSIVIIGYAWIDLLFLVAGGLHTIAGWITLVQGLTTIAIGLAAFSVAVQLCDGLWRRGTLICLVPLALQRLSYLWLYRNEGSGLGLYITFIVAPPFVLLASLYVLPRPPTSYIDDGTATSSRKRRYLLVLLRVAIFLLALVALLLSSFTFCTGMDILGVGLPSMVTSLFAIAGAFSALLYALNPSIFFRRALTINVVATALALHTARFFIDYDTLSRMDLSGWIIVLLDFVPLTVILVIAIIYPSPPTSVASASAMDQALGTDD